MKWKTWLRRAIFPHAAWLAVLTPGAAACLIYAMTRLAETSLARIGSYVLAFYVLCLWCVRVPGIVRFFKNVRRENKYLKRWHADARLRVNVTLTGNAIWNGAYAALQLGLGIRHRSAWFYALAAYYASLALMRLALLHHTLRHRPGEKLSQELRRYRACGWVFLVMNLALSCMIFLMIRENRAARHHEITTIAMAAYTFLSMSMAIVNVIRYRKYQSPAFSASKAISLASACVSMLTLENTMLETFQNAAMTSAVKRLFLSLSGGAVSVFIVSMAVYMIARSSKKLTGMEK